MKKIYIRVGNNNVVYLGSLVGCYANIDDEKENVPIVFLHENSIRYNFDMPKEEALNLIDRVAKIVGAEY